MKITKLLLLAWPIGLLLGMYGYYSYERQQIDTVLLEADGLTWEEGDNQFTVQIDQHDEGELLFVKIKIVDPEKKAVFKTTEVIDRDMLGGGFVRAVQVDQDPEKEIVVWHSGAEYYLDFSGSGVQKISFDGVPQQVKNLAQSWHKYNVTAAMEMAVLILLVLCYYFLYFLVKGIMWLFKRRLRKLNPTYEGREQKSDLT